MRNLTDNLLNVISKETFKKLFLLHVIGEFQNGVFGKKRLQKIIYIMERNFFPFMLPKTWSGTNSVSFLRLEYSRATRALRGNQGLCEE